MPAITSDSGGFRSLSARGIALCVLQLLVTAGLPVVEYFLFYSMNPNYWFVPITTWCITCIAGGVGLWALLSKSGTALALHSVLAVSGSALSGWFNTQFYFDIRDRCGRQQASFIGCSTCTCAATNACLQAAFNPGGSCGGCSMGVGTDVCSYVNKFSITMFMGVIQAVLILLPAASSLALLVRVESQSGRTLAKLAKIKVLLAEELARYDGGEAVLTPMGKLTDIVRLLATYGGLYDRQLAERAAGLWGIDLSDIRAGKPRSPQVLPITIQVDTNSQGAYAADYGTESGYGDGSTADGAYGDYYGQGGQADEAGIGWQDEAAGGKKGRALSIRR